MDKRGVVTVVACVVLALWCGGVQAQNCMQSLNVKPDRPVVLLPWDNPSGDTLVLTCGEAERMRGQIFRSGLAFLSNEQLLTMAKVKNELNTAFAQLQQLQTDLAAAHTDQQAQAINAVIEVRKWTASKASLLICAVTVPEGPVGILGCGAAAFSFVKQSVDAFQALQNAQEAQQRATRMAQLLAALKKEYAAKEQQWSKLVPAGSAAQYRQVFESLCNQVKSNCL